MKYSKIALATLLGCATLSLMTVQAADLVSAKALYEKGQFKEAQTQFSELHKTKANKAEAAFYLGQLAFKADDVETAMDFFDEAVDGMPKNADAHYQYALSNCRVAQSASVFRQLGLAGDCKNHALEAIALNPRHFDARDLLLSFYLQAPGIAGGGRDKAEQLQKDTAALDSNKGLAMSAQLAISDKKFDVAEQHLQALIAAQPDKPDALLTMGLLQVSQEKFEAALTQFRLMAERFPQDARAPYQIGRVSVLAKNTQWFGEGEQAFKQFFTLPEGDKAPSKAWAYFRMGELYELMAKPAEAKVAFAEARKLNPDDRLQKELAKKV